MNNQRVNSQDEARHNVIDNQIPLCPLGFVDAPAELVIVLSLFFFYCPRHTKLNALYKAFTPAQTDCGACMFDKMEYTPSPIVSEGCSSFHHTRSKSATLGPSSRGMRLSSKNLLSSS